jgi:hypothetical protein
MFRVKVSQQLLEAMTLAAIEAYCYGSTTGRKWRPVETLGYIWGFRRQVQDKTVFFLDRMSLSISSIRASTSVEPNPKAAVLKNEVVTRWSPHLTMLGDFHSQSFRNLAAVTKLQGFEFSDEDFQSFLGDDFIWNQSENCPVMLAITICRLNRVREKFGGQVRSNICSYAVGQFRFWLAVSVGFLDELGNRQCTGNKHSKAELELEYWLYNAASDRVL